VLSLASSTRWAAGESPAHLLSRRLLPAWRAGRHRGVALRDLVGGRGAELAAVMLGPATQTNAPPGAHASGRLLPSCRRRLRLIEVGDRRADLAVRPVLLRLLRAPDRGPGAGGAGSALRAARAGARPAEAARLSRGGPG